MLRSIHQFSNKWERNQAFSTYYTWKNNKKYTHSTINEDGKLEEHECSMYTYHVERSLEKQGISPSNGPHSTRYESKIRKSLL